MANEIALPEKKHLLNDVLRKSFQSANINFIIGSGCSSPAIEILGNIENAIQELLTSGNHDEADKQMCEFLQPFVASSIELMSDTEDSDRSLVQRNYESFIARISSILAKRQNNILPKQASIFTTNYDLFVEKASEFLGQAVKLNDGFNRSPVLNSKFIFSPSEFFNTLYNNGNLYKYQVEIPSINLIKLHGSLSWKEDGDSIVFSVDYLKKLHDDFSDVFAACDFCDGDISKLDMPKIKDFNNKFAIVLPRKDKFPNTLLNQIHYDLLRIYANELDKENTLLLAEGFSFADEHIYEITKRALRNPTLRLIIFCYKKAEKDEYSAKFNEFNNVDIVYHENKDLDFVEFNELLGNTMSEETITSEEVTTAEALVADESSAP